MSMSTQGNSTSSGDNVNLSMKQQQQVRFQNECILIPPDILRARPHLSTRSFSISLPLRWPQSSGGPYQLDSHSQQRVKDPTLTLKLPSISTRPRRATCSGESEPSRVRSCLRSPGRDKDWNGLRRSSPTLSPLVENSTLCPASSESNRSTVLEAMTAIANVSCASPSHACASAEASSPDLTSPPTLSPISLPKAISPTSYLTRRRGASLSTAPIPSTSPPTRNAVTTASPPSPTLTKASTLSSISLSSSQLNPTSSQTPVAERHILLRPCCETCIATLAARPSSLLPIASEADAHWSPRAKAKKVADEKEEEAVKAAASETAKANMGCIMRLWGDKPSCRLQNNSDADKRSKEAEVMTVKMRSPLSPESLKRNKELLESFNGELRPSVASQLAADLRLKNGGTRGEGRSDCRLYAGDSSSPDDDLKNLADVGGHGLRLHGHSHSEDLFDEEEEDDNNDVDGVTDTETTEADTEDENERQRVDVKPLPGSPQQLSTPSPRTPLRGTRHDLDLGVSLDSCLSSLKPTPAPPPRSPDSTLAQSPPSSFSKLAPRRPGIARSASEGGAFPPSSFKTPLMPRASGSGSGSVGMGFMNILRRRSSKDTLPTPTPSSSPSARMKSASTSNGAGSLNILSSLGRLPGIGA